MDKVPDPITCGCCFLRGLVMLVIGGLVLGWLGSCLDAITN